MIEIKDGPYDPSDDKYFTDWAPKDSKSGCMEFSNKVLKSIGLNQ